MRRLRQHLAGVASAIASFLVASDVCAQDWSSKGHLPHFAVTREHDISLTVQYPASQGVRREERVTAQLMRPVREGTVPAAVIINSSGGVAQEGEFAWGRFLSNLGIATLVVDSFGPRGIRRTTDDQSRLDQFSSSLDGAAGGRWLAAQSWVDADRILIMGTSRGGNAALANALVQQRAQMRAADVRFALHVAITPGCGVRQRDTRTTGAPIAFFLAELDDYTPARQCFGYAEKMQLAGTSPVRLSVLSGAFHSPELPYGAQWDRAIENYGNCNYIREEAGGTFTELPFNAPIAPRDLAARMRDRCMSRGATAGGDPRLRARLAAELTALLQEYRFVDDPALTAVFPDCDRLPDDRALKQLCGRARAGWPADATALAVALFEGRPQAGLRPDTRRAVPLLRLMAERGETWAQLRLALALQSGVAGLPADPALAFSWLRKAHGAGYASATNALGVALRDGIGTPRDENAAGLLFQEAASNGNDFAMANYGRMLETGSGGVARNPAGAVFWFQAAATKENPWGQLYMARAMETGLAGPADTAAALRYFRAAAAQDFAGRAEAQSAMARLAR